MKRHILKKLKHKLYNFDIFELGNSTALYYLLIFYLVPLLVFLSISDKSIPVNYAVSGRALLYVTLGLLALVFGYFNPISARIAKHVPNIFQGEWNFRRAKIIFWITLLIGIATKVIRILGGGYSRLNISPSFLSSPFYSTIGFLDWVGYIALIIAFSAYYYLRKRNNANYIKWKILAWMTFVIEIIYAVPSCKRHLIIIPVFLYLIVRSYRVKLEYWRIALVVVAIIFLVFPFGNACRNPQVLIIHKVVQSSVQSDTTHITKTIDMGAAFNYAFRSFLYRIDQSRMFSKIVENNEYFLYGTSFSEIFTSMGPPRFIWKSKPVSINAYSNEFGHQINVLGPDDSSTSVGPTIVGDWYMNFGVLGIVVGMFLMGVLWRFIYEYLIKETSISLSGVFIYSLVWVRIMQGIENWVVPPYMGFIKLFVVLLIIHCFIREKKSLRQV